MVRDPKPAAARIPAHDSGDAVRRAQSRLHRVRVERRIASCRRWRRSWASITSGFRYVYPKLPVDASHARFVLDQNRCILCTRCVRVCDEIEGAHTWDVMGRGSECAGDYRSWRSPGASRESCTSCGKCVQVCPTGALSEKGRSVAEMSKRRQFLPYLTLMRGETE